MELYLQSSAAVLLAVILILLLNKNDFSLFIAISVCCLICISAVTFLKPVIDFLYELEQLSDISADTVSILLKCAGIGLLAQMIDLICLDAGERALGKALSFLSSGFILFLSLPLFRQLISLLKEVLMQV